MLQEPTETENFNLPLYRDDANLSEPLDAVTPDNPPWTSPLAFVMWILSVLAIVVFPGIGILTYMGITGKTDAADLVQDEWAILINLVAVLPAHLATLGLAWLLVTARFSFPTRQTLGFESGGMQWWHYAVFIAAFFIVSAVIGSFIPEGDNDMMRMLRASKASIYIVAFLATFTAPVVEEVIYRGVLYSAFQRTAGVPAAVAIVTILFALIHVPQYWGSPTTIVLLVLLSLSLTIIRVKTKNLWPCIVMHTIFNGVQSALLLAGISKL